MINKHSCTLTPEQKTLIADTLIKAQPVVARISTVAFGKIKIRKFRNNLDKMYPLMNPAEKILVQEAMNLEPLIINGFAPMVMHIVNKAIIRGFIRKSDREDRIQDGLQHIMLSMLGYDGSSNLTTYFWYVVVRSFQDKNRKNHKNKLEFDLGDYDVPAPVNEYNDTDDGYDLELLSHAMQCVNLNTLERTLLDAKIHGLSIPDLIKDTINPKTGKPYTRTSAYNILKSAQDKVKRVYATLLVRRQVNAA